jgi:hypothetical protein
MFDRHWLGDVVLAVLLAIPTAALAAVGHDMHQGGTSVSAPQTQQQDRSAVDNRFSLFAPN